MRRRRRRLQLRRKDPERGGRCRRREGSGCGRNKLRRRTGVRSKVAAKGVRGGNHGRDGGGQQGGEQARRDEELPAAVRETLPGKGAAARRSEGAAGAGARRGPVGGASPSAHRRSCQGPGPGRSAVGWFQLPASRPPAPPAAARPPHGPRSPPSSAGSGTRPAAAGAACGSRCGTWRGDPAAGDKRRRLLGSHRSQGWLCQACTCPCAKHGRVCLYRRCRYIYMGLDLYLMARIKLLKVAAM